MVAFFHAKVIVANHHATDLRGLAHPIVCYLAWIQKQLLKDSFGLASATLGLSPLWRGNSGPVSIQISAWRVKLLNYKWRTHWCSNSSQRECPHTDCHVILNKTWLNQILSTEAAWKICSPSIFWTGYCCVHAKAAVQFVGTHLLRSTRAGHSPMDF